MQRLWSSLPPSLPPRSTPELQKSGSSLRQTRLQIQSTFEQHLKAASYSLLALTVPCKPSPTSISSHLCLFLPLIYYTQWRLYIYILYFVYRGCWLQERRLLDISFSQHYACAPVALTPRVAGMQNEGEAKVKDPANGARSTDRDSATNNSTTTSHVLGGE